MNKETASSTGIEDQIGTAFEGMGEAEICNRLNEDRVQLKEYVNTVAEAFYARPSKDLVYTFCNALVDAYIYQVEFAVPCEMHNDKPVYKTKHINGLGWAYLAYTISDHTPMEKDIMGIITANNLIEEVIANKEAPGIAFNPESSKKGQYMLFLNRENLEGVLRQAKETIEEQPKKVKEILLRGKQRS